MQIILVVVNREGGFVYLFNIGQMWENFILGNVVLCIPNWVSTYRCHLHCKIQFLQLAKCFTHCLFIHIIRVTKAKMP